MSLLTTLVVPITESALSTLDLILMVRSCQGPEIDNNFSVN